MNLPEWEICWGDIKYYIVKLVDHATIKTIISIIGTILTLLFGDLTAPMQGFLMLLAADYITGLVKASKKGELSSWFSRKGWGKIATYAIVISLGHLIQQIGLPGMRDFALLWAGATEGISVLENFDELGLAVPSFLREKLLQTKERKFDENS